MCKINFAAIIICHRPIYPKYNNGHGQKSQQIYRCVDFMRAQRSLKWNKCDGIPRNGQPVMTCFVHRGTYTLIEQQMVFLFGQLLFRITSDAVQNNCMTDSPAPPRYYSSWLEHASVYVSDP